MTQSLTFPQLGLLTVRDPKAAAEIVLTWRLSREALWTAVVLIAVIVTILTTLSNALIPLPESLQAIGGNPLVYLVMALGAFVATVVSIYWTGRLLGGTGTMHDLMTLLLWLQVLRAAAQAVILVMLFVAPLMGSLVALAVGIATIWIFINFISVGMQLNSLLRAVFVLILGAIVFMLIASFLLSVFGVSAVGVPLNV